MEAMALIEIDVYLLKMVIFQFAFCMFTYVYQAG